MATKIVNTPSNPQAGEINQSDLKRIIQNFEDFVEIKSTSARPFKKVGKMIMRRELMQSLLDKFDEDVEDIYISINFGITLPDQVSCFNHDVDISNELSAVILLAKNFPEMDDKKIINIDFPDPEEKIGYAIVHGFKSDGIGMIDPLCCGDPSKNP
jgi:hypothetical protein